MKKDESNLVVGNYSYIFYLIIIKTHKHTHISFNSILAGILSAGKKRSLDNLAVRFVCQMCPTLANRRIAQAHIESL